MRQEYCFTCFVDSWTDTIMLFPYAITTNVHLFFDLKIPQADVHTGMSELPSAFVHVQSLIPCTLAAVKVALCITLMNHAINQPRKLTGMTCCHAGLPTSTHASATGHVANVLLRSSLPENLVWKKERHAATLACQHPFMQVQLDMLDMYCCAQHCLKTLFWEKGEVPDFHHGHKLHFKVPMPTICIAGTGICVQTPFHSSPIALLAWLRTRPPCPLHFLSENLHVFSLGSVPEADQDTHTL